MKISTSRKIVYKHMAVFALSQLTMEQTPKDEDTLINIVVRAMDDYCHTNTCNAYDFVMPYLSNLINPSFPACFYDLCKAWDKYMNENEN